MASESPTELSAKPKRKARFSATKATIKEATKLGWSAGIVERHISFGGRQAKDGRFATKFDLFGCIDIVALDGRTGVMGIQATSSSGDAATRRSKIDDLIAANPDGPVVRWLHAGNRLEVWCFPERKQKRGGTRVIRPLVRHRLRLERVGPLPESKTWDELPIRTAWKIVEGLE